MISVARPIQSIASGARDGDVIEARGAFASGVEADGEASVGEPRKSAAAAEALKVDHPVAAERAHLADAAKIFAPAAEGFPAAAVEGKNAREIGVALEEWDEVGVEPPVDVRVRLGLFDEAQDGQRLHHVAQ